MTATATSIVKDQELVSVGVVESPSVDLINDFTASIWDQSKSSAVSEKEDFVNTFICHIIFYVIFCVSLVLHILIDLGLGSFIRNKIFNYTGNLNKTIVEKNQAYA